MSRSPTLSWWMWAVAAGVAIGFAYTLSPLTVIVLGSLVPLWRWASRDLPEQERRWLFAIFIVAVGLRLMAIGGLFLSASPDVPYANFFGDDEFFKRKSTWLRNVGMGIPISTADYIYAFDDTGDNSYLRVLSYAQALMGLSPYGIHVMNVGLYLAAVLMLYRLARSGFGAIAGIGGLALLLFLPSLFIWSVSALKEPLYFLVVAVNLALAVTAARASSMWHRVAAVVAVALGGFALQSLREGGLALTAAGVGGGYAIAYLVRRPRSLIAACVVAPIVMTLAFTRPTVQVRTSAVLHQAAMKHWGYVNTPGLTYKLMDPSFYVDRKSVAAMSTRDMGRYVIRSVWSYVTVPLPWAIESRSALAFLPEQMIWYSLLVLVPFGISAGLKRDSLLTSLLLAHGTAAAFMVAVSGGNIGTLVRHRGLALPYFAWLGGLGAVRIAARLLPRSGEAAPSVSATHFPSKATTPCL